MTEVGTSATFEPGCSDGGSGLGLSAEPPAAKRARFEATADLAPEPVTEIAVREDGQAAGEEEVHHLTVPQTQFEIEINSGSVEDEDGVVRETILPQDLNGPAFAITTASQVGVRVCLYVYGGQRVRGVGGGTHRSLCGWCCIQLCCCYFYKVDF